MKSHQYRNSLFVILLMAVLVFFLPQLVSSYILNVLIVGMCTYLCVMSVYVLLGMCGQNSFAQAGLWGVGGYITANLTIKLGMAQIPSMLLSILGTALICFVLGFAFFRLKQYYFTFATIGLMTILNSLFTNWNEGTGGAIGMKDIPEFGVFGITFSNDTQYLYLYFGLCAIAFLLIKVLYNSALGRSFMAIRDNEIAANCMGVNSLLTKSIAFGISGALCGLAGAMYAFYAGYLSYPTFTYNQSTLYLVMLMLGGTMSPVGAVIGSFVIIMLQEWLRPLQEVMMFIYGVGIIVLMVFQPEGILGGVKSLYDKCKNRGKARIEA